jgi:MFS family permease
MSFSLLGDQLLYAVLPSRPGAAGIGVAALGVILSANRFIRLGANSLGGVLCDRFGRRRPFLAGMALAVISTAAYWLTSGFWPLLAARLVWGLAFALCSVAGLSIILDVTTAADRGRTVGFYHALVQSGTLLGLVASGVLTDLIGYRGTLALYVPLTALGFAVAWFVVGETNPANGGMDTTQASVWTTFGSLDRRLLAPGYIGFASFFAGNGILMATLGASLKEQLGSSSVPVASLTGILLASRRLAGMIFAPVAGHLSDRSGDRRRVAGAGALMICAGFVVLATGSGVPLFVTGVVLTAIGEGVLHPSLAAWIGDRTPPELRGVVMGGYATANDLGGATGPIVGYAVAATLGFAWAYGLCVALMATALVAVAIGQPGRGSGVPPPRRSGRVRRSY